MAAKARNCSQAASAGTSRHSEGAAYNPHDGEIGACRRVGRMGPVSDDGPGHYNPDRSEGPWGRAVKPLARRCCAEPGTSTQSEEYFRRQTTRRTDANQVTR